MVAGITYDLRSDYLKEGFSPEETAEFDRDSTVAGLEEALRESGYRTVRIGHLRNLVTRLASGERWDIVFNICEGMYGIGREAQVPALLDGYGIPYTFSDPLVLSLTLHKGLTKDILHRHGIVTPKHAVVTSMADIGSIDLEFPLFVKPVAEGTGKGISGKSKVVSLEALNEVCLQELLKYPGGLLVEEYLPGREITVGILGTGAESRVAGTMEIIYTDPSANQIYSLDTKSNYEELVRYQVPEQPVADACSGMALKVWKLLGCRDAGRVDIRYDRMERPSFIEINPLAGLDKDHSDLPILAYKHGYTYARLIREIMESAAKRIPAHV